MIDIRLPASVWSYDPARPLGAPGGFGAVFIGAGPDGSQVAVKRLHIHAAEAAHRELTLAADLANKDLDHVMPVLDSGQDANSDGYYVVMPLAERSLQDYLEANGILDEAQAIEIINQIVTGLHTIRHIVHRDLKPGNILFHEQQWKIADFGIARFVEDSTSARTLKECLSPMYAAPEQWRLETATNATDVYALGCIAFTLITGKPPFTGTIDQIRSSHLHDNPEVVSGVSSQLRALIGMMLRKSPAARPTQARVKDVLTNLQRQTREPKSGNPLSRLAAAAAVHEQAQSAAEAERARQRSQELARATLAKDAQAILEELATELGERVASSVPTATVVRAPTSLIIQVGSGKLELELNVRPYREADFPRSKWDVVCGTAIGVEQSSPVHQRSASLWYTRQAARAGEYRWVEVGYMGNPLGRRGFQFQPTAVEAELADRAHWAAMDVVQAAYHPVPVDGESIDDFCDRWLNILVAACEGRLQHLGSGMPSF